jgi:hypothetical protein
MAANLNDPGDKGMPCLLTSMFRWTSSRSTAMVGPILSADTHKPWTTMNSKQDRQQEQSWKMERPWLADQEAHACNDC